MDKILVCTYDEKLLPYQGTPGSVCWDIKAAEEEEIQAQEVKLISSGIKIALPTGWGTKLYARSSSPIKKGYMVANSVGILDADYRGIYYVQVYVIKNKAVKFEQYERIAQIEFFQSYIGNGIYGTEFIPKLEFVVDKDLYDNFDERFPSDRGAGSFGSTGKV